MSGGYDEQPWDFILWTDFLEQKVAEHQALMAKTQPQ